jgi:hypothetical protein
MTPMTAAAPAADQRSTSSPATTDEGAVRDGAPDSATLLHGIRFAINAALRRDAREDEVSAAQSIVDWVGQVFGWVFVPNGSRTMQIAGGEQHGRHPLIAANRLPE